MSKHTPGPWRLQGSWDGRLVEHDYVDVDGNRLIGNICVVDGKRGQQNEANARLIAAAPDLLEALRKIMQWVESHPRKATIVESVKQESRAAIAKAEGR